MKNSLSGSATCLFSGRIKSFIRAIRTKYVSPKCLKSKLQETYDDQVFFLKPPGNINVVCLKNKASEVLINEGIKGKSLVSRAHHGKFVN